MGDSTSNSRSPQRSTRSTGGATGPAARRAAVARPARSARSAQSVARPTARPAAAPRGREHAPTARAGQAWVRWVILAAIALVLLVTLVPTARSVLAQRAEVAGLADTIAAQERDIARLQAEQQKWQDPVYVEQQARERLKFVKPGDRSYTVIDPAQAPRPAVPGVTVSAPQIPGDSPWYGQVWESVRLADQPAAGLTR